jgi:hypothetical protein
MAFEDFLSPEEQKPDTNDQPDSATEEGNDNTEPKFPDERKLTEKERGALRDLLQKVNPDLPLRPEDDAA